MDVKNLLGDKKKLGLYALGAGAALGAVVWYRRRQATGGGGASTGSGGVANPAYANTTGTDTANWVGQTLGSYSDQLAAYQKTLTDEIDQLTQLVGQQQGNTPPAGGTPAPAPVTLPNPGKVGQEPITPISGGRRWVTVEKFTTPNPKWDSTLSGIAGVEHTTVGHLLALNPNIHNANLIYPGQRVYYS